MLTLGWVTLLLLIVLFAGLPVAFSLGATSVLLVGLFDLPVKLIASTVFTSLDSFVVIAIPLFVLMSRILLDGKVGDDLFEVMNVWVRHLPGDSPSPRSWPAPSSRPSAGPGRPRRRPSGWWRTPR